MDDCIFCKIIRGEVSCEKIYEDDSFFAFLDAAPQVKGHTLIVPKKHFENLMDIDEKFSENYIKAIRKVGKILIEKYNADGFNVVLNNGEAAGQIVNHVHFHILPRKKGDGYFFGLKK